MTKNLITRMNKKIDVTHALQLKLRERMNKKSRFEVLVTSYGRNKNSDEIKKTKRRPIIAPAIAVRLITR